MRIKKYNRSLMRAGLTVCLVLCMQCTFCQVQTITDKKDILIGEQVRLTIRSNSPVRFVLPDSIPHFEIVENGSDSVAAEKTITITSFDSGRWRFPSLPVQVTEGASGPILHTDSFYVNVTYAPADSTNQLRDIKPIIQVEIIDYFWYYIIAGAILLLLVIYLLYRYFRNRKKEMPVQVRSKLTAFDEAIEALNKLALFDLHDAVSVKNYHTALATIFKQYLGRKQGSNLLNKTSGDILINVKENGIAAETISELAAVLRITDAVKFAKYFPLSNESEDGLQKIRTAIQLIEQKMQQPPAANTGKKS